MSRKDRSRWTPPEPGQLAQAGNVELRSYEVGAFVALASPLSSRRSAKPGGPCSTNRFATRYTCDAEQSPSRQRSVSDLPCTKPRITLERHRALREMVRTVGRLGGYIDKPRADAPCPQAVWLGLQRAHDFALCWQMFGPEAENGAELV
jgi:hypothetical protein